MASIEILPTPAANIDRDAKRPPPRPPRSAEPRQSPPDSQTSEGRTLPHPDEEDCELIGVRTVGEALDALLS